jgi:hypothetical protein
MLKSVHITDNEDETVIVKFDGDGESDVRSFWLHGRALLEQVARICVEAQLDQIKNDWTKEMAARQEEMSKKAA